MSVKVAVRVRPFNQRQINLGCSLCVNMEGKTTRLLDSNDEKKTRDFAFDYSFWSHDQFQIEEDGYSKPLTSKYADQKMVYQSVGKEILENAWEGYHCCLFAYGQTGSGKSYSMIGYGANSGIVPKTCEKIFEKIGQNLQKHKQFQVQVSMMEIYNEKVQDLLISVNKRPKEGLKIRQHKTQGVYVEGLSKHYVNTYEAIKIKMQQGNTHRSVAATEMNASSSRAHTIISIQFRQKQNLLDKKIQRISVIHLVDLAGSERVQKTGAEGTRLKEAANINKSLSILGLVISNLADKAMGKGKNTVIPYRDSCLTRILQNALGGNSKTLMICAISPASDNYDETLSTLRYADQAKKIQNKAVINQNQTDKMIRQLTQENEKLKKMMDIFNKMGIDIMDEATLARFYQAKSQLHFNNQMMKGYTLTAQQKNQQSQIVQLFDQTQPHVVNLNEDPMLSKKIRYLMTEKGVTIGRKHADPPNDIVIGGVGILTHHAVIFQCQNQFFFKPLLQEQDTKCFINGLPVVQKTRLFDQDRLICGTNSTFLVLIDGQPSADAGKKREIDWEFAQQQLYSYRKQEMNHHQNQKAEKQRIRQSLMRKQLEFQKMQLKKQNEAKILQLKNQNIKQQEKYKQEFERMKAEIEVQKGKLKQINQQENKKTTEKSYYQKKLSKYIPKLTEINEIAKQLGRDIRLSAKIMFMSGVEQYDEKVNSNKVFRIKVINRQVGYDYYWNIDKFYQRYYEIKDLWEEYLQKEDIPELQKQNDPFWDPPQDTHICYGYVTMMNLPYILDNQSVISLVDENGECGRMTVVLTPTDGSGNVNLSAENQKQPEESVDGKNLIGSPFYFNLQIKDGRIPSNYQDVYLEYSIKLDDGERQIFKTERIHSPTSKINFDYKYTHKIYNMTQGLLDYFRSCNLCIDVYGMQKTKTNQKQNKQNIRCQNKQKQNLGSDLMQKLIRQTVVAQKRKIKKDDGCCLI